MNYSTTEPTLISADQHTMEMLEGIACRGSLCDGRVAEALNEGCFCISLNGDALRSALESTLGEPGLFALTQERCPYVFAAGPVFISGSHVKQMRQLVQAVESVVALPAYRSKVLANAPDIARHDPGGARGVFFGFDFHLHRDGISLIEINTNAGGAMLNAALAKAQKACCASVEKMLPALDPTDLEKSIVDMFLTEWRVSGHTEPLRTIAIVDESPEEQYLYPEFLLFQQLFRRHGLSAVIVDPRDLAYRDGALWYDDTSIDLVYNRLTDFMLEAPYSASLRAAYLHNGVVLTPHPQAHALYANKRNLTILTDPQLLAKLDVPQVTQAILLQGIPRTEIVLPEHADRLWTERRKLFFKPLAGYGSRAAYRGDKVTKRVWEEILVGDYVAQSIVAPSERMTGPNTASQRFKFDVRAYSYEGSTQWVAARLYQGQTTNFRTPGGGFAPVYQLGE
jgi:hypothetical protein